MSDLAAILRKNPNLASLSDAEANALIARCRDVSYGAGDLVLREGDAGESMVLLAEGTVLVKKGETTLAELGPGATIGEMALLDPAPRSATVVAKGKVRALELDREQLWSLLATGDTAAVKALQGLSATVCSRLGDVNRLVQEEVIRPRGNAFSRLWTKLRGK
jgi:CRP/FNR family cyclic AMP-dependent transcriptional regulator